MWLRTQKGKGGAGLEKGGPLEPELWGGMWKGGEIRGRDLNVELSSRLAYTTVMTTLDRLYKKGLLDRRKVGKAFLYIPRLTEGEYQAGVTSHLLSMALHGADAHAVLSSFVDKVSETDQQMLDRLDELVTAQPRAFPPP